MLRDSLPEDVRGRVCGGTSSIRQSNAEFGGDRLVQPVDQRGKHREVRLTALHDQHGQLGPVAAGHRERGCVGGTHFGLHLGQVLEILRPDVAAVDDQQILGAAGEIQRTIDGE